MQNHLRHNSTDLQDVRVLQPLHAGCIQHADYINFKLLWEKNAYNILFQYYTILHYYITIVLCNLHCIYDTKVPHWKHSKVISDVVNALYLHVQTYRCTCTEYIQYQYLTLYKSLVPSTENQNKYPISMPSCNQWQPGWSWLVGGWGERCLCSPFCPGWTPWGCRAQTDSTCESHCSVDCTQ